MTILGMLDVGMIALKLLAVAGGATVGGLGSGVLLRLLVRLAAHRPVPRPVVRSVQILGAVAFGSAVWFWAFGIGGSGFGLGGTGVGGQGKGPAADLGTPEVGKDPTNPLDRETTVRGDASKKLDQTFRVEMLGGQRVKEQRFYVMEGETEAKTLGELRKAITARQQQKDRPSLKELEIVIYEDSVAQDHPAVRDLEKWARQNDLGVKLALPKRGAQ